MLRLQLEACFAENRQLRFNAYQQTLLGCAAAVPQGLPPHAIVGGMAPSAIPMSTNPTAVSMLLPSPPVISTNPVLPLGQQVMVGEAPQGQNEAVMNTDAAIAQLLMNQRAAANAPASVSDTMSSTSSSQYF